MSDGSALALYLHLVGGGLVLVMLGIWIGMASEARYWRPKLKQLTAENARLASCNKAMEEYARRVAGKHYGGLRG